MINKNINQIYSDNPITTLPATGLIYVGSSGGDTAIHASDIFPSNTSNNALVRFNGTTGTKLKTSNVTLDDDNNLSGLLSLTTGSLTIGANNVLLGGTLTTNAALTVSGAFATTVTVTATTAVTFPTSGILATTNATIPSIAGSAGILVNGGTALVTGVAVTLSLTSWAGFTVTVLTGGSAALQVNRGYVSNYTGGLQFLSLPATSAVGDIIMVTGLSAGRFIITLNSGQVIHVDSRTTSPGPVGQISSTAQYDSVFLICTVANTEFNVISYTGTLTVG